MAPRRDARPDTSTPPLPRSASPTPAAEPSKARWGLPEAALAIVSGFILQAIALAVVLGVSDWETFEETPIWVHFLLGCFLWLGWLGLPILFALKRGEGPRRDLRLSITWSDVPLGIAVGLLAQVVAAVVTYALQIDGEDAGETARSLADSADRDGIVGALLFLLFAAVAAPLAEEVCFRGMLFGALERRWDGVVALVVSSVVFAAIHFQPAAFPGLLVIAFAMGELRRRTGRLGPSIAAHMGFNLLATITALAQS